MTARCMGVHLSASAASLMNEAAVASHDAACSEARAAAFALGTMERPDNGAGGRCQTFLCSLG